MKNQSNTTWLPWLVFIIVVILGGSNSVAVRFSNQELPPFWGAAFRFISAALLFWAVTLVHRIELPKGRALVGTIIYGAMTIGIAYAFYYWALVYVTASLTMVVLSLGPLLTFLFAWVHGQETFRWQGLIGAVVAFGGILFAAGSEIGGSIPIWPFLALVAGTACVAEGTVYFKSFPKMDPLVVNAIALSIGAVILLVISLIAGETWKLPTATNTWFAYGYLVVGGSGLLFYFYLYLLERWTASATSYTFLMFPLATVVIASWLLDEVITTRLMIGGAFVLLGVWAGAVVKPK